MFFSLCNVACIIVSLQLRGMSDQGLDAIDGHLAKVASAQMLGFLAFQVHARREASIGKQNGEQRDWAHLGMQHSA